MRVHRVGSLLGVCLVACGTSASPQSTPGEAPAAASAKREPQQAPEPAAVASSKDAPEAPTCGPEMRTHMESVLARYCEAEPNTLHDDLVVVDEPADPTEVFGNRLEPQGIERGYREIVSMDDIESVRLDIDPEAAGGTLATVAIAADTPASMVETYLRHVRGQGVEQVRFQLARARKAPLPPPPDPVDLARIKEAKNDVELAGPYVGCLDWIQFMVSLAVLTPDARCQVTKERGLQYWLDCDCPGTVSQFEQQLYLIGTGRGSEHTPAGITIRIDDSATIEVPATATWADVVAELGPARPLPFWLKVARAS